jgi:hypothetical protein
MATVVDPAVDVGVEGTSAVTGSVVAALEEAAAPCPRTGRSAKSTARLIAAAVVTFHTEVLMTSPTPGRASRFL